MANKTRRRIYCRHCDFFCYNVDDMVSHMERKHNDMIPPDMDTWQYVYYLKTGKTHGNCIICKGKTEWNKITHKYHRFCDNPLCKQKYRKLFENRMVGKYGKTTLLNDPEHQKKMLANRSISGIYVWRDRVTKTPYTGSYEKNFLEFLDTILEFDPNDIIAPSPHTYYYMYEGKKHFYIPDFFIPSLELEIEIKDGGTNPNMHHKIQDVDKVKEKLKDDVMSHNHYHYIKIIDKENTKFFEFLTKVKESIFEPNKKKVPVIILEKTEIDITDDDNIIMETMIYEASQNNLKNSFNDSKINKITGISDDIHKYFSNIIENDYKGVDPSHSKEHIYQVTNAAIYIGSELGLDINVCLAIGALHDIGLTMGEREEHHINSGKWVKAHSKELSKFFSNENIDIIEKAVTEHRSSTKTKSTEYSKVISDADKIPSHNIETIIKRAWDYTKFHNKELSDDEMFESMYSHIHEKYGTANIYGNKFYTKPAIDIMKPTINMIIKYTNNKKLCLKKLNEIK